MQQGRRGFDRIVAKLQFNSLWGDFQLGSRLIDQSQKMTVAASAIAEKKTVGHRS